MAWLYLCTLYSVRAHKLSFQLIYFYFPFFIPQMCDYFWSCVYLFSFHSPIVHSFEHMLLSIDKKRKKKFIQFCFSSLNTFVLCSKAQAQLVSSWWYDICRYMYKKISIYLSHPINQIETKKQIKHFGWCFWAFHVFSI